MDNLMRYIHYKFEERNPQYSDKLDYAHCWFCSAKEFQFLGLS